MDSIVLSPEAKEACELLGEVQEELEQIEQWLTNEVNSQLNGFIDRWLQLCQSTDNVRSKLFVQHALQIVSDLEGFHRQLVNRAQCFAAKAGDRLSVVKEIAAGDSPVKNLQEGILSWWNDAQQPRIAMFFNKSCELEGQIHEMIDKAIELTSNCDRES